MLTRFHKILIAALAVLLKSKDPLSARPQGSAKAALACGEPLH